jgi:hypothetical protein
MSWGEGEGPYPHNRVLSYKQVCKFAERGECSPITDEEREVAAMAKKREERYRRETESRGVKSEKNDNIKT